MPTRIKNYYTYSLSNNVAELNYNQFSKAVYYTVVYVRVRKQTYEEVETIHFGEYVRASASIKRSLVFDHLNYLNEMLDIEREEKSIERFEKKLENQIAKEEELVKEEKKKAKHRKPKRSTLEEKKSTVEVINSEFIKDINRDLVIQEVSEFMPYDPTFDFYIIYVKQTKTRATQLKKKDIKKATHIKVQFGNKHEGRRDLTYLEIPEIFRGDLDSIDEYVTGIQFDYETELKLAIEHYGKRYFMEDENVVINDVISFPDFVYLDVFKTFSDALGMDYYVRKFYQFYIDEVPLFQDKQMINQNFNLVRRDFHKLMKYARKREVTDVYISRLLVNMGNNEEDNFIAQGVGPSKAVINSDEDAEELIDATLDMFADKANAKASKYRSTYSNINCDGFTLENRLYAPEESGFTIN